MEWRETGPGCHSPAGPRGGGTGKLEHTDTREHTDTLEHVDTLEHADTLEHVDTS